MSTTASTEIRDTAPGSLGGEWSVSAFGRSGQPSRGKTLSFEQMVGAFEPISLDALNVKAAMLERLDNKYVVGGAVVGGGLS
jgi:hypothetical protein